MAIKTTIEERLITKSRRVESGCLEWQGKPGQNGYGELTFGGAWNRAHVWAYLTWVGDIPEGLIVQHTCDNPPCIEPTHLVPGPYQQNNRDAWLRGGQGAPKLSGEQIIEIRTRYAAGGVTHRSLAEEYGVSKSRITKALRYSVFVEQPPSS
jgi:hypothetical protein